MMPIDLPIIVLTHEFAPTKGGIATFTEEMARAGSDLGKKIEIWAPICQSSDDSIFPFKVRRVPIKGTQDLSLSIQDGSRVLSRSKETFQFHSLHNRPRANT